MKKSLFAIFMVAFGVVGLFVTPMAVAAQEQGSDLGSGKVGVCTFIGPICNALGINNDNPGQIATNTVRGWVNLGITLLFIGIILIAVFIIVQAAIKYIQSQGDEGKIAEAQKAIKSVFIGIALLFVGIIGIVLVLAFFSATNFLGGGDNNEGQCVLQCVTDGCSSVACSNYCKTQSYTAGQACPTIQ